MKKGRVLLAVTLVLMGASSAGHAASPSRIVFSADRASAVSGVVYRVAPSGHRAVLAHGWRLGAQPTVSPNGRTVAFLAQLKGAVTVDEIGLDGHGLIRVGPTLAAEGQQPYLAWQPHGTVLALTGGSGDFWLVRPGRKPVEVLHGRGALQPSWSPDGRVVTVQALGSLDAFTSSGRRLWTIGGGKGPGAWSPQGLVAAATGKGVDVYSERGSLRFQDPGTVSGSPAWSPAGMLAAVVRHTLEVQTPSGAVVLREPLAGQHELTWDGDRSVVVGSYSGCGCDVKSVEIRTGKTSSTSDRWFDPLSRDGRLAVLTSRSGSGFALQAGPPGGGRKHTYTQLPGCWQYAGWTPAAESLQFAGPSRAIVYASLCSEPEENLYSVASQGGAIREITHVKPYATQPALSPSNGKIAYVWAKYTGISCSGCASSIRVANADGTDVQVLTSPQECTFDSSPTWSPDGQTILFSEDTCNSPGELYTVPASGGAVHDLGVAGSAPAWGPSKIAYAGSRGVWEGNPDGTSAELVGPGGKSPAWSPDGTLAYLVGTTLVVGSSSVKLPFAQVTSLAWSPDGAQFVVTARKTANADPDVYTIGADGRNPVRLTQNYDASGAIWSG